MFKFLLFAGALVWLIFVYGGSPSPKTAPTSSASSAPQSQAPWAGMTGGLGRTFWEDQAKAGTALWKRSETWCEQKFQEQQTPTVTGGVCTLVLGIQSDLEKQPE